MRVVNVDFTGNAGVGGNGNVVINGARDIQFPINRNVVAVRRANGQFTYLEMEGVDTITVAVASNGDLNYTISD